MRWTSISYLSIVRAVHIVRSQLQDAATQASLEAKAKRLREKQDIERKLAELQREREMLELEETIEMSWAKENVLAEFSRAKVERSPQNDAYQSEHLPEKKNPARVVQSNPKLHLGPIFRSCAGPCPEPNPSRDFTRLFRLPVAEVKKFSGENTELAHFIRSFDLKIGSKVQDSKDKLYYLEQHMVEGSKPHHIVASCLYLEDGYEEAKRLLQRRYGQPSTLASSFLERIMGQTPIRMVKVLTGLQSC